jgi:hypothetical protein
MGTCRGLSYPRGATRRFIRQAAHTRPLWKRTSHGVLTGDSRALLEFARQPTSSQAVLHKLGVTGLSYPHVAEEVDHEARVQPGAEGHAVGLGHRPTRR